MKDNLHKMLRKAAKNVTEVDNKLDSFETDMAKLKENLEIDRNGKWQQFLDVKREFDKNLTEIFTANLDKINEYAKKFDVVVSMNVRNANESGGIFGAAFKKNGMITVAHTDKSDMSLLVDESPFIYVTYLSVHATPDQKKKFQDGKEDSFTDDIKSIIDFATSVNIERK